MLPALDCVFWWQRPAPLTHSSSAHPHHSPSYYGAVTPTTTPRPSLAMEDTRIRQTVFSIAKSVESFDIFSGRYKCSALVRSGMYGLVVARPSVTTLGTDNLVCRPSPASPPLPSRTNLPHSNSFRGHYLISSIQGENCLLEYYFHYYFSFIFIHS